MHSHAMLYCKRFRVCNQKLRSGILPIEISRKESKSIGKKQLIKPIYLEEIILSTKLKLLQVMG